MNSSAIRVAQLSGEGNRERFRGDRLKATSESRGEGFKTVVTLSSVVPREVSTLKGI